MNKKFRNKVIKEFLKLKLIEIVLGIVVITLILFVPYYLGIFMGNMFGFHLIYMPTPNDIVQFTPFQTMLVLWLQGFLTIIVAVFIIGLLYLWISSNWRKAEDNVREYEGI